MSIYEEEWDEDSMPCPCQRCGEWFDLLEGYGSEKWFPNTVICSDCYSEEEIEINLDNEIEDLKTFIYNAKYEIKGWKERLEDIYKTYKPEDIPPYTNFSDHI